MKFNVEWMPDAIEQLAAIWTNAANRSDVTKASNGIDQKLAVDPLNEGESRGGIERITFENPLRVLYRVFESERKVEVHSVGTYGRRPS
jgi:DNA-binding HxlR family transcriptional regulator